MAPPAGFAAPAPGSMQPRPMAGMQQVSTSSRQPLTYKQSENAAEKGNVLQLIPVMTCSRHLAAAPAQLAACRSSRRRSSCRVRRPWAPSHGRSTQDPLRFACHLCSMSAVALLCPLVPSSLVGSWIIWSQSEHDEILKHFCCRQADGPYGQPPPQQPLPGPPAGYGMPQQPYGGPMQPQQHGGPPGQFQQVPPQVRIRVRCRILAFHLRCVSHGCTC